MTAVLSPPMVFQGLTPSGQPLSGGLLSTYVAGTSTPQATYTDSTQSQPNTNPVVLNASGQASVWLDPSLTYKFSLTDSKGNQVTPAVDQIQGVLTASIVTQQFIGKVLYPQTLAEQSANVTPIFFFYPFGNVLRYGAVGDGATNNFTAFQQAQAVCKIVGQVPYVPPGNYAIDTSSGSLTLEYGGFQGDGVLDGTSTPAAAGSVLSIIGAASTPFNMRRGTTFDGVGIYYPAQVDSSTPIVFPPTINVDISDGAVQFCYIQNCTVFNAYRFFVDTDATGAIGHVYIDNNSIYGILTCFEIAYNAEIIHWTDNDFTFGLFVSATEGGLRGYTRANGTVLQMVRTDGFTFTGNLMFGYLNGISFPTVATIVQLMNIVDNVWDNVRFGIIASGTGNITGMTLSGNTISCQNSQNTALLGTGLTISTSGTAVAELIDIGPNFFGTTTGDLIKISGNAPTRSLNFSGGIYTSWAAFSASGAFAAFNISGNATVFNLAGALLLNQSGSTAAAGILGSCSVANISATIFGQCVGAIGLVGTPSGYNFINVTGCLSFGTSGAAANNYFGSFSLTDVGNSWDKNAFKSPNVVPIAQYTNAANDSVAASAGVPVGGMYRNGSVVQVRVT